MSIFKKKDDDGGHEIELHYINGEAQFDDESGTYMPVTAEVISETPIMIMSILGVAKGFIKMRTARAMATIDRIRPIHQSPPPLRE